MLQAFCAVVVLGLAAALLKEHLEAEEAAVVLVVRIATKTEAKIGEAGTYGCDLDYVFVREHENNNYNHLWVHATSWVAQGFPEPGDNK